MLKRKNICTTYINIILACSRVRRASTEPAKNPFFPPRRSSGGDLCAFSTYTHVSYIIKYKIE